MKAVLKWLHGISNNATFAVVAALYITRDDLSGLVHALSTSGIGLVSWLQDSVLLPKWAYLSWVLVTATAMGLLSIPVTRWVTARLAIWRQRLEGWLKVQVHRLLADNEVQDSKPTKANTNANEENANHAKRIPATAPQPVPSTLDVFPSSDSQGASKGLRPSSTPALDAVFAEMYEGKLTAEEKRVLQILSADHGDWVSEGAFSEVPALASVMAYTLAMLCTKGFIERRDAMINGSPGNQYRLTPRGQRRAARY